MLVSVVEIKCKRCGKTTLFKDFAASTAPVSFMLFIDMAGVVIDACQDASVALAYSRSQLIGKSIADICPLLCESDRQEKMHTSFNNGAPYEIKQNVFFVRDGGELPTESYCIAAYLDGTPAGYRMLNWTGKNSGT